MSGAFRSILLPTTTAVAQLPATSQTKRLLVLALPFSVPAATEVDNEKAASAAALARPLPRSLAVHVRLTFAGCQAPSGAEQTTLGAIVSSGGLLPLVPASIHC